MGSRKKSKAPVLIEKSPNDARAYRAIELSNGLQALLIEDLTAPDSDGSSDGSPEVQAETGGDSSSDTSIPIDQSISAAALCIGIGSFSDPPEVPGLAHFLEHMVYMGSKKYPDENHFDMFLKKHGGSSNAYTDLERTVFYFDIRKEHFRHALDIFAQFFIAPLMKKDSIEREIRAIDSEFDQARPVDKSRKEQLLGTMAKKGHPMSKFMWGNRQSLKIEPESMGIDIYSYLKRFHAANYSSHFMTLVLHSRDLLDDQEKWVREIFSVVPYNQYPIPDFGSLSDPFDTRSFYKLYKVIPVQNMNVIEILWALPPLRRYYRTKPLHYLGWLIGHEGKGGILSYLKKQYWATKIVCGNNESGFEFNQCYTMLGITVNLTDTGMEHVYEIIYVIFEYLAMLRNVGVQKRIFNEIQQIEDNHFRWIEQVDPADYVEGLCCSMQRYPPEHFITGDELITVYDPKVIELCLSYLTPKRMCVIWWSRWFENDNCDRKEKWFQTEYKVEEIPIEWKKEWENIYPRPEMFHIPAPNQYIASDFSIRPNDTNLSLVPEIINETHRSKLWYHKDNRFKVPKAYCFFKCMSPVINHTPREHCMMNLFVSAITHNLDEIAYDADVASLSYDVKNTNKALYLRVSGFNHNLHKLFKAVVDMVADLQITDELFVALKEEQSKNYFNSYLSPAELMTDIRMQLLRDYYWTSVDRQIALNCITKTMLTGFIKEFKETIYVESLVTGNMMGEEARTMETYLISKLQQSSESRAMPVPCPRTAVSEIPRGEWVCRVENFNKADNNSVIINYYQHGPATMRQFVINDIMCFKMQEPCFDILRTREQLGYEVYNKNRVTEGIVGFSITVYSQADKFSMQELDDKIESFLLEFERILDKMTPAEFETTREALIGLKKCEDSSLQDESNRFWREINNGTYLYNRHTELEIAELEKISHKEVKEWFKYHIISKDSCKKLSIQIQGHKEKKPERYSVKVKEDAKLYNWPSLKYVKCAGGANEAQKPIMNIAEWKSKLRLYPPSKVE